MAKVVWSDLANRNLRAVIDYRFENWSLMEVKNFQKKISKLIDNIAKNNSFCPKSQILNLRKCLVDKNNSLIYLYENNVICIVTMIHNRAAHQY